MVDSGTITHSRGLSLRAFKASPPARTPCRVRTAFLTQSEMKNMSKIPSRMLPALAVVFATLGSLSAQSTGPDVIVGDLPSVSNWSSGSQSSFAIGTTSCNIGTSPLLWQANNSNHPVIGQNIFRVKDGVFEQIGQGWLKHGFLALAQSLCDPCQNPGTGSLLGVGCSDPYSSGLNGSQSGLGPRSEVNPSTGVFPYPPSNPSYSGSLARRIIVDNVDLDPSLNAGARYFGEGHYVTPDDAAAGNKDNNASHREMLVTGPSGSGWDMTMTGQTVREQPAITAWPGVNPSAQVTFQDVPNDGRIYLGFNVIALPNGDNRYVYAVHNLNSDRAVGSIEIQMPAGYGAQNLEFRNRPWHSGETWDASAWNPTQAANGIVWSSPNPQNQNGSAVRWGSTFTFIFESAQEPGDVTLSFFKSGTPASITFPAFVIPQEPWQRNQAGASLDYDGLTNDPYVGPIEVNANFGQVHTVNVDGVAGAPYDIAVTALPTVARGNGAFELNDGQVFNLPLSFDWFFGGFLQVMPAGGFSLPLTAPSANLDLNSQLVVLDAAAGSGLRLSAANEWSVRQTAGVLVEAVGSNSYNSLAQGFWKVTHQGSNPATVTEVTLDFGAAQGSASSRYLDCDQTGMSGDFRCGGTYRFGSAAATGLIFDGQNVFNVCGLCGFSAGPAVGNTYDRDRVTFRFTPGSFSNETFSFDADTDGGGSLQNGGAMSGLAVTVTLDNGDVYSGFLQSDPGNANRSFLQL